MSAVCPKCNGRDFDYLTSECLDCADAAEIAGYKAEIDRLKTELGAASFIAAERTRNSIVAWCRSLDRWGSRDDSMSADQWYALADRIEACEDINPP